MKLAMVGLGRMGGSMTERLLGEGYEVVAYARDAAAVAAAEKRGANGAHSMEDLVRKLAPPRVVWLMIPVVRLSWRRSARSDPCSLEGTSSWMGGTPA